MISSEVRELTGFNRTLQLKLRFGLSKLPFCPVRYRLHTDGRPDTFFQWTRVMPFMDPVKGAFNFELYGWDVRELRFLRRFLTPGMTFIDIGAHHGLYAILAAHAVGLTGRVLAFEPSPAAARRLRWHLRLNGAASVEVSSCAVGAKSGASTLFVPTGGVDTISSLRPSGVGTGNTRRVAIELTTLDAFAAQHLLRGIDLIKLDVEGAEADVLEGAAGIIAAARPLWLFEALDSTSAAWGSSGRALVDRFVALGHELLAFTQQGRLEPHAPRATYPLDSNCNLLAVPQEKLALVLPLLEHRESR